MEGENYVGRDWSGLSALVVIVAVYLGRWPRLVWGCAVGAGCWVGMEFGTVLFTGGAIV
jgi:hypothetical protein